MKWLLAFSKGSNSTEIQSSGRPSNQYQFGIPEDKTKSPFYTKRIAKTLNVQEFYETDTCYLKPIADEHEQDSS